MYGSLVERLRERIARGEVQPIPHATAEELGDFHAKPNECHSNVARWCREHPGHRPVIGWLITSGAMFDKHSIVDRGGAAGLFDITPMSDRRTSDFLAHEGTRAEFDAEPNHFVAVNI